MAVTVYCDESETCDTHAHVFTVAGWVGVPSAWALFDAAWRELLSRTGPSPVQAFHAVDLLGRKPAGEFLRWRARERVRFCSRAIDILLDPSVQRRAWAVAATIDVRAMRRHCPDLAVEPRDLYVRCVQGLLCEVLTHGVEMGIDFMMDEKDAVAADARIEFRASKAAVARLRPDLGDKLGDIAFADVP